MAKACQRKIINKISHRATKGEIKTKRDVPDISAFDARYGHDRTKDTPGGPRGGPRAPRAPARGPALLVTRAGWGVAGCFLSGHDRSERRRRSCPGHPACS